MHSPGISGELRNGPHQHASVLRPSLSIVVPAYNEEEVIEVFHDELIAVLKKLCLSYEVVYVNDGGGDGTVRVMADLARHDPHIAIVDLSRNFGKELALTAGLDFARGEAVVVIDADLQDPPALIEQFVQKWREGYDVIYAKRISRDGETELKKLTAFLFYRLIQGTTPVQIPADTGDYRLISRRALEALLRLRERRPFHERSLCVDRVQAGGGGIPPRTESGGDDKVQLLAFVELCP